MQFPLLFRSVSPALWRSDKRAVLFHSASEKFGCRSIIIYGVIGHLPPGHQYPHPKTNIAYNCPLVIPAKAFARDYVITGVGLSVCLSVCLFVCLFVC